MPNTHVLWPHSPVVIGGSILALPITVKLCKIYDKSAVLAGFMLFYVSAFMPRPCECIG
eukprot:SAG22_NODE_980_length_6173_cov_5.884261_4_plen_59_part_00